MRTCPVGASDMAPGVCEACRVRPVEVTNESDDAAHPYRVCSACDGRLRSLSLRPLEWFNLAARHGNDKFLLHDDFYYPHGAAQQPKEEVVSAGLFPFPTLEQVQDDLERLVDYTYVLTLDYPQGHRSVVSAFRRHRPDAVLEVVQRRAALKEGPDVASLAYQICAEVLGATAGVWVRGQWAQYPPDALVALAEASAACLPFEEGFARVSAALEGVPAALLPDRCHALAFFHSPQTLNWMEAHPRLVLDDAWGEVAALSHFSWARAERWLAKGRPLSIRALHALAACYYYDTPALTKDHPTLEEPASVSDMSAVLDDYLRRDDTPDVRRRVNAIKRFWGAA